MGEPTTKDIGTLEWWTSREVANRWRVSVSTIHRMYRDDPSFGVMVRGSLRIHRETIEKIEQGDRRAEVAAERDRQHKESVQAMKRAKRAFRTDAADPSAPHRKAGVFS